MLALFRETGIVDDPGRLGLEFFRYALRQPFPDGAPLPRALTDELLHRLDVPFRQPSRYRLNRFPFTIQQQSAHIQRTSMAPLTAPNRLQEIDEELLQPLAPPEPGGTPRSSSEDRAPAGANATPVRRQGLGGRSRPGGEPFDLLRQRSVEARHGKARRGELVVAAPVGYLKTEDQRLEKNPDQHGLQLPARTSRGELTWKRPAHRSLYQMMTNPVYGGACAYGKTEQLLRYENGEPHHASRRKPGEHWLALIPNMHEGYLSWEEFEGIQQAIRENLLSAEQPGAAGELERRCNQALQRVREVV